MEKKYTGDVQDTSSDSMFHIGMRDKTPDPVAPEVPEKKLPKKKVEGKGLLHPNCDCKLLNIQKPTNQMIADCNITKFTDYI